MNKHNKNKTALICGLVLAATLTFESTQAFSQVIATVPTRTIVPKTYFECIGMLDHNHTQDKNACYNKRLNCMGRDVPRRVIEIIIIEFGEILTASCITEYKECMDAAEKEKEKQKKEICDKLPRS